ncbi:putative RNA-directed DNA polymerase from transposon X-element [Amphibalanus amphitrite]|uniref:Putative RNA-directed DNA polymerase from transposon X-element n=1 Tax=Amphibalanus amphitrite TaxID=1232801 RepID=A0A6A4WKR3_AMPAM|nr:putative RNA-directed DNA polymerase from transposon X-element [Amphibalanus amphitrite]
MVAHWNVRGIKTRRFDVEKFSERYDVLLLQETLLKPNDIYELPGFDLLRSDARRGTMIAVRNRPGLSWRPVDCLAMCSAEWDVQGIVVSDTRMTGDLHIYNVYVSRATAEGDWGFLHQIESTNGHTVVAGDFNARSPVWCCSRAYNANGQALEAALQGLDSELISLLRPTRLAERYGDADTTIDLCLVSSELTSRVSWRPTVQSGSDHLLCEARIVIPRSAAAASRQPRRPQLYPRRGAAIDELDRMRRAADREARRHRQQGTARTSSSQQPKWWTDSVDARWIEKQRALRRWRVDRRSSDEDTRVAARSVKNKTNALFKRAASTAYNECWDAYIDNVNNNTTMFWRFVSTLDSDQPNTSGLHIEHNGTMLRTEEQRGEAFLGRFIDQCSQQDLRERQEARSELDAVISEATEPPTFTAEDLDEAIRRLSDTACGPDRLRAGDFRALTEVHRRSLLAEINTSVACGTIPAHWTDSFLVPIPKPGKDHRSLGGYRVITVQNIGGKLVESMIARKLSAALEAFLPPTLGAYRSGRATWLNVGQVVHKATEAFEAREHALIVGLDLQDAYNLVSVPILVRRLRSLGIDPFFVRWILQALQARRCALRSGRWLSDWTTVTMALPQGSPPSPVCFNAYTLPLATLPVPPNFTVYTFADDILLCGTGGCLPTVANQMQEVLDDTRCAPRRHPFSSLVVLGAAQR